jgi:5-methylthioribose kinase
MFHEIHPLSTLPKPFSKNALKRIPPMTSQQCLAVVIRALESDLLPLRQAFRNIIPSRIFTSTRLITRNDIQKYHELIIDAIWSLYSMKGDNHATRDEVIKLLANLSKNVDETFASFWEDSPSYATQTYVKGHIISLVEKLNHDDLLPSIVFNFSRKTCNALAITIGNYVEKQ